MARHKHRRKRKEKKYPAYDPPIWVEGRRYNEKTGLYEPIKYKLRNKCG